MTLCERLQQQEEALLSPTATASASSRGRRREEAPCTLRTPFQRDRDRIVHCKAFRRLMHKTQVFIAPEGDHFRTRLTHTLEVAQIARTVARGLRLNEDLTEAIALGHDLGHTPFGHGGERAMQQLSPSGFAHNQHSLRVVDLLEKYPLGLNLCFEVRDGILCHTGEGLPCTLEGQVVRICDRIAYINHDIDDAVRAGILSQEDLPKDALLLLGESHRARINSLVSSLITEGEKSGLVALAPDVEAAMLALREALFSLVYRSEQAIKEEDKAAFILKALQRYILEDPRRLPPHFQTIAEQEGPARAACDYIAGMSDRFALSLFRDITVPRAFARKTQ